MLSLSSSLDTKDTESAKIISSPKSLLPAEVASDCDSYLPFEIPRILLTIKTLLWVAYVKMADFRELIGTQQNF